MHIDWQKKTSAELGKLAGAEDLSRLILSLPTR